MKLNLKTKINAILVIEKNNPNIAMSSDMNMTLMEWVMRYSMSDFSHEMKLPNLVDMRFNPLMDASTESHKMTAYVYNDSKYRVVVNVIED